MARVLIVDDEQDVVRMLQFRFETKGHEVDTAFNGAEAMEKAERGRYDLVLMDYYMPSLKGDEVCRNLRAGGINKTTPVIIMTAFSDRTVGHFKDHGANEVVYKPIDVEGLLDKVITLLSAS